MGRSGQAIAAAVDDFKAAAEKVGRAMGLISQAKAAVRPTPLPSAPKVAQPAHSPSPPLPQGRGEPTGDLTGPQQPVLDTVLVLEALGIHPNGGS